MYSGRWTAACRLADTIAKHSKNVKIGVESICSKWHTHVLKPLSREGSGSEGKIVEPHNNVYGQLN